MKSLIFLLFRHIHLTFILTMFPGGGRGSNVLVLIPLGSVSHKNVFEPIISGLAGKGHNLTVVTAWEPREERENVRELVLLPGFDHFPHINTMEIRRSGMFGLLLAGGSNHILEACVSIHENEDFKSLLKQEFHLILMDTYLNECFYGLIWKLRSPFIWVSPLPAVNAHTSYFGNRLPPSFVQDPILPFSDKMNFGERVINLMFRPLFEYALYKDLGKYERIYRRYLGPEIPGVNEISRNVSLMLMNSHFTLNFPRPTLPDVVEVGGAHCRPGKPLTTALETFVSGSAAGTIVFSLGSIVKPHELSDQIRDVFVNVFRKLSHHRILWKWPEKSVPGLPGNVRLIKWIPQQDVLAHPNVVLFITHCGLLSLQEAIYHAVPTISVPIFGDQDLNARKAAESGIGETVEILTLTENILEQTIHKMLNSTRYVEKVRSLSQLFRDRSQKPLQTAVYWTEYVMRHNGAPQLRSSARDLNSFQYYSIDVVIFLFSIAITLFGIILFLTWKILTYLFLQVKVGQKMKNS